MFMLSGDGFEKQPEFSVGELFELFINWIERNWKITQIEQFIHEAGASINY